MSETATAVQSVETAVKNDVNSAEKVAIADTEKIASGVEQKVDGVVVSAEKETVQGIGTIKSRLVGTVVTFEGQIKSKFYLYTLVPLAQLFAFIGGKFNTGAHYLLSKALTPQK